MVKIRIFHRKNFEECELQVTQGRGANEFNTVYRGEDLPPRRRILAQGRECVDPRHPAGYDGATHRDHLLRAHPGARR
jgi:hypothetical protein